MRSLFLIIPIIFLFSDCKKDEFVNGCPLPPPTANFPTYPVGTSATTAGDDSYFKISVDGKLYDFTGRQVIVSSRGCYAFGVNKKCTQFVSFNNNFFDLSIFLSNDDSFILNAVGKQKRIFSYDSLYAARNFDVQGVLAISDYCNNNNYTTNEAVSRSYYKISSLDIVNSYNYLQDNVTVALKTMVMTAEFSCEMRIDNKVVPVTGNFTARFEMVDSVL